MTVVVAMMVVRASSFWRLVVMMVHVLAVSLIVLGVGATVSVVGRGVVFDAFGRGLTGRDPHANGGEKHQDQQTDAAEENTQVLVGMQHTVERCPVHVEEDANARDRTAAPNGHDLLDVVARLIAVI